MAYKLVMSVNNSFTYGVHRGENDDNPYEVIQKKGKGEAGDKEKDREEEKEEVKEGDEEKDKDKANKEVKEADNQEDNVGDREGDSDNLVHTVSIQISDEP